MSKITNIIFTVNAAKSSEYDEASGRDMPNWKVCDYAQTCEEAMDQYHSVRDYPIVEFHIETEFEDGSKIRVPVFGGITERLVNGLWEPEQQ